MSSYFDIDPQDINPETNRTYANYSSPSLETSFHDEEMDVDDDEWPIVFTISVEDEEQDYGGRRTEHSLVRVSLNASLLEINEWMRSAFPATRCYHEYDCCGNYYANSPSFNVIPAEEGDDFKEVHVKQCWVQNV